MINWETVNGFSKAEFAPTKSWDGVNLDPVGSKLIDSQWDMHPALIDKAQELRSEANENFATRMIVSVNGGYAMSGHAEQSLHYGDESNDVVIGHAMDFHYKIPSATGGDCWAWYEAALFTWKHIDERYGLGFYPHSNTGFVHLDYREDVDDRHPAVWWQDNHGKYQTYPFDQFPFAIKDAFQELNKKEE